MNLTQTWNAGGVTFTGLKFNVTETAAASGSLYLDIQSGGATRFSYSNAGVLSLVHSTGTATLTSGFGNLTLSGELRLGGNFTVSTGNYIAIGTLGAPDTFLHRDAAGVFAQRNSTTQQTFRVYSTFTDASNYQRLTLAWSTTTALVHNQGAGTGADGSVAFNDAALATSATKGFVMIPSCAGAPSGVPADIPTGQIPLVFDSTNNKLYAYDGGWISTAALT
jgi:hypothetical protein